MKLPPEHFRAIWEEFNHPPQKRFIEVGDPFVCRAHGGRIEEIHASGLDVTTTCGLSIPFDLVQWDPLLGTWFAVPQWWNEFHVWRE